MLSNPVIRMVALCCIALSAACNGSQEGATQAAYTEVDLVISDPDTPPAELVRLIDFVSYRITCPASGLTPYDDSIDLAGNFEVDADSDPPVWQLATDLPLSSCAIALWVFYEDEVICQGDETLPLVSDEDPSVTNKVNIVLECNLSVTGPSADLDVDGSFEFIHGNYCPKLNWLGAVPVVVQPAVPATTIIETSAFDIDSTCGLNCDPQTCDFTQTPPLCTPAPDPGFSSTFIAPAGHGSFDPPVATGIPMTGGTPIDAQSIYTCDPLFPGPTEICVVVSDGDNDCDQMRCITIVCPDLCENVDCDDGNECTRDACDTLTGLCTNDDAPDGIACDNCNSTCQLGACDAGTPFSATVNAAVMNMVGSFQTLNTTVTNPYSGETISLSGNYFVNTSSYKGIGTSDLFLGSVFSDVLFIYDLAGVPPESAQRLCGVEALRADNGFDVMLLADDFIVLGNMEIFGGNANDTLWANAGDDTLRGLNGKDRIDGGPGDDIIEGGNADDTITLWPGSGFDSIMGGDGFTDNSVLDRVEIDAIQSQILISPALNPSYEFDIFYLGTPMAQIREIEFVDVGGVSIDLSTCTGGAGDVCNLCGNDALNGGEECDDGNNADGDGCAADCTAEY